MKQIDEWLREGRIDVGVVSKHPHEVAASDVPLFAPTVHLIGAKGNPETRTQTIEFARLAKLPLIVPSLSSPISSATPRVPARNDDKRATPSSAAGQ